MAAMAQLDCGSCGYLCQTYAEAIAAGADKDISKCSPGGKETKNKLKELLASKPAGETASVPASPKTETASPAPEPQFTREHPFPAPILEIRPLTRKDSQKDVRFVSFGLRGSGLTYEVGDALGVYPENCAELVDEILTELDATGDEPTHDTNGRVIPARIALAAAYVVNRASEEFLEALSAWPRATMTAKSCSNWRKPIQPAGSKAATFSIFSTSSRRRARAQASHVGFLVSKLAPLRARLYSISSSLKAHPNEVHLTVGMVRYKGAQTERVRKGVASTFLGDRC
jgi:sulfite reductase (NADPH) flavoprotein alpha-component